MADHDEGESGHFYNCSEKDCYSPIEIISLDKENIGFKCFNPKGSHQIKMKLKNYLDIIIMNFTFFIIIIISIHFNYN